MLGCCENISKPLVLYKLDSIRVPQKHIGGVRIKCILYGTSNWRCSREETVRHTQMTSFFVEDERNDANVAIFLGTTLPKRAHI